MLCRLCLLDSTEVLKIFEDEGIQLKIADIIAQHFWFMPKEDDQVSKSLCRSCWSKVNNFHEFYCEVEEAQKKLNDISVLKQDPTTQNTKSFKKEEEEENTEWMVVTSASEYVNVISLGNEEPAISEEVRNYKIEHESKDSDDDELKNDDDYIKDPIQSDRSDEEETEVKYANDIVGTLTDSNNGTNSKKRPSSSTTSSTKKGSNSKKKRGRPKKKPPNASDSEEDIPLTQLLKQKKPKKDEKERSEWLKKSQEDDEKIAKYMKLKCEICCEELVTFAQVKQHYRTVHNKKGYVVCCNKKLYKRVLLLDHVNKHINPEYFKCDECNKTFADKQCLKNHMYRHESDEAKIFKCDQCPRKYAKQYLLEQHRFIHVPPEERQFICDDCGKAFSTNSLLNIHHRYVHQNAYGNMCHICAKVIRGKTMFEKHQLEHAGIVEPKVQCNQCGAWLKHEYSLRKHMRRHMESLVVHKCDICGKIAPSRGALRSHLRYVHEAERTYRCGVCDKAFKKPINLKEHMSTHTGEVLYTCPHCPRTFNSSANMFAHRKKVHRKEWEELRKSRGQPDSGGNSSSTVIKNENNQKKKTENKSIEKNHTSSDDDDDHDDDNDQQQYVEIIDSYHNQDDGDGDGGDGDECHESTTNEYLLVLDHDENVENIVYRSVK